MNMKKWMDDVRDSNVKKSMPILSFPCVSLLGVTVSELINSSDLQAKGMKAVADRVDSAAAVSMMDLSVEAEAFGAQVRFSDTEVPTITGALITSEEEAEALNVPEIGAARTSIYIDAIVKACELIKDRPVFAGVIGPFSLAGRLMDVTETLVNCYVEPDMVKIVMEKVTQFLIKYIQAYKNAGANGVVMAEPVMGLLSPDMAAEFAAPYVKQIIDAVQDDEFIVIYHNCGDSAINTVDSILSVGAAAYQFGNSISMAEMMKKIPGDIVAMGNIDPVAQFCNGTAESIRKETLDLMNELCNQYPNFLISSGCDIPPKSSWENIDSFFNAVTDFYANK